MTLSEQIAAKLAVLNTPQQIQGRSGVVWGYDPQARRWFTEGPRQRRSYANTTMGIPESVGEGANVSADGNVMDPGKGGGLLHGNQRWDDKAGKFVTPFSFDKLALYGTLGALTAGTANAVMAGGAGAVAAPGGVVSTTGATGATVGGVTGAGAAGTAGAGTGAGMGAASLIGRGIDAGANIYGANRANAASNRAASASERAAAAELAFLREQELERRRQWEADQAFQAQKWKAEEEERAFNRKEAERRALLEQQTFSSNEDERLYRRRLEAERDARREPYRAASAAALGRLGTILSPAGQSQWRSPSNAGRGTLGSMVGR